MKKAVRILSTKKLEQVSVDDLSSIAEVVDYDVLEVQPLVPNKKEFYKNIIFTSFKATLRGLELLGDQAKKYHYFCVGKKSEQHLKAAGLEVYGFANYSKDLAELLIENLRNSSFSYLCSEDRLSTLPDLLSKSNVIFEEVYTYKTEVSKKKPEGRFDIYLWFSPKGVKCMKDIVDAEALHICIGETTAKAAKDAFKEENVYYPETPRMEDVIRIARKKAMVINSVKCAETVTKK
ncbi:uroporphyrinogen-III synthase [Parvicella tangerina]|uniref:Uroporphyrinogen-III synthase n=1 Tax=Parvicella tangerina TaxID=2829795 RepID=A0A916JNC4_9FLAO|nr:uroporphyrinogen-III synthase [Parvicella tangerina]CAG5083171.1 hypothetical protein CRYO30217_02111 [Parvicella tangerina]